MSGARHQARQIVLQALYEIDCTNHAPEEVTRQRLEQEGLPVEAHNFVYSLVNGVLARKNDLDLLIQRHAPEWPIDQMAIIDRNILRISIYEISNPNWAPVRVVINEAVELAKDFGSDTSPRFINGVLGSLVAHDEALKSALSDQDAVVE